MTSRHFQFHRTALVPLLAGGLLAAALPARAQTILDQQMEQPGAADQSVLGHWDVTLGVGPGYAPRFEGAKRYHFVPVPYGVVSVSGLAALGPDGLSANILHAGGFRAGVVAGYGNGRDQSDDPHLRGLGDISASLQLGGFVAYRWEALEVRAQARQSVTHTGNGLEGTLGVTYELHPAEGWMVKAGPQLVFADGDYMKTFFGVSADQARASGLRAYSAGGGLKDVALGLNTTYALSQHWLAFGIVKLSELVGDAADSPITQSKQQAFTGVGLAYHF